MKHSRTRSTIILGTAVGLLTACGGDGGSDAGAAGEEAPAEVQTIRMGSSPWIGHAPFRVADDQGFDTDNGFELEFITLESANETTAAIASGEVDVSSVSLNTAMPMLAQGLPIKIIHLEDVSLQADAVVVREGIETMEDLRGKKVASELGTTSHMVLDYALREAGMSTDDIELVPLLGSEAGSALLAGRVDAAATWEPYISAAVAQDQGFSSLVTADILPGLVSDVVVAQEDYLAENGDLMAALLRAWDAGLAYMRENEDEVIASEAALSSVDPEDLRSAFDGLEYYDNAKSLEYLSGTEIERLGSVVSESLVLSGLMEKPVDIKPVVELGPLEQALESSD